MNSQWVYGAAFPVSGKENSVVETKAIREDNGTWTAQVAHLTNSLIEKRTFFGGFDTRLHALRTANEIALALADGEDEEM